MLTRSQEKKLARFAEEAALEVARKYGDDFDPGYLRDKGNWPALTLEFGGILARRVEESDLPTVVRAEDPHPIYWDQIADYLYGSVC